MRLKQVGHALADGTREVVFDMNGETRTLRILDKDAGATVVTREKADASNAAHVGAPMPGVVVDVRVAPGTEVKRGDAIAVLSAMKMETVVTAPRDGVVRRLSVAVGDNMEAGDLIFEVGAEAAE